MSEAGAGYPDSYYAASANPAPARPALAGERAAEVCIVGAGFTGLSAALELAERGHEVVVLEAAKVGWGASGRNGGQIVNGLNASLETIERRYGRSDGRLRRDGGAGGRADHPGAGGALRDRLRPEGRATSSRRSRRSRCASSRRSRRCGGGTGIDNFEMLDRDGVRRHVASDAYAGGMLDRSGGHLHPLNLALGQAAALEGLGGVIHEATPGGARSTTSPARPVVRTARGAVRPEAADPGRQRLSRGRWCRRSTNRVMPFSTQIMATEPLGERGARRCCRPTSASRTCATCSTTTGCRRTGGCSGAAGRSTAAPIRRTSAPSWCRTWSGSSRSSGACGIDYRLVGELRHLVQPGAADGADRASGATSRRATAGTGWSGATSSGESSAEAVHGDRSRFDVFARVPWIPFPGGRRFAVPYSVLGSWWYGLRDRLGV